MKNIHFSENLVTVTKNKYIFLDTCFFLDFVKRGEEFDNFHKKLLPFVADFLTTKTVELEFLKGSQDEIAIKAKGEFLQKICPTRIQITGDGFRSSDFKKLILRFKDWGKRLSYTDLSLAACLQKWPKKAMLLTSNFKDFPLKIFSCEAVFTLHENANVKTYCLYQLK